jgi:glucuronate isomerase
VQTFIDDNFLLHSETARELYHTHAAEMPIIDFHCHLPPREIAENSSYSTLTQVWLGGDHYKWRAMRTDGVDERYITGDAPAQEKFYAWARTIPHTVGNPLYHWTHLELLRYFGIKELLEPASADRIYARANDMLQSPEFRVHRLLERMKVRTVCTTDDPTDSLEHHRRIRAEGTAPVTVAPTFRPDKVLNAEDPGSLGEYLDRLAAAADIDIRGFEDLLAALERRIDFFHGLGCRSSDHALQQPAGAECSREEAARIFSLLRGGTRPSPEQAECYKTAVLTALGRMYAARGWVMQLHFGAMRNNNSRMFARLGPDTGFDAIADGSTAAPLARFLDLLDRGGELPKTVIYILNPRDNMLIGSLIGCFQDGSVAGKVQFGSGWWFNDQKDGMERQMTALANTSLLYRFIGMLTDSRSFLSFPRHEYFRRILCNLIGSWADRGEAPRDMELLGEMVRGICYRNAAAYFGFGAEENRQQ